MRSPRRLSGLVLFSCVLLGAQAVAARAQDAPPTPTFTDPVTLTGPGTIAFDEDVRGVSNTSIVLKLAGTSTAYPIAFACATSAGTSVDCSTGPLRSVVWRHNVVFVPGERYQLTVNPSGAGVQDLGGNNAATVTETFFGSALEQEDSPAASYAWKPVSATAALDGWYRTERVAGSVSSFRFYGTGIAWVTVIGPTQGWAVVGIDGSAVATVNNYAARTAYQVMRRYTGLERGVHTITLRVTGQRGARGGDAWVSVDAFKISTPNYEGTMTWPRVTGVPSLRGAYRRTATTGARAGFRFRARGVDWYTATGPDQGRADVYIDGVRKASFDNYSPSTRYAVRRSITGLTDTTHTVTIVVTGARGWIVIDAWSLKAPVIAFAKLGAWIDLFDFGAATDPSAMLDVMKSKGVRTVYLETARYTSMTSFGDTNEDFTAAVGRWVDGAHARGLRIIGWYFPGYGEHMETDVARTLAIYRLRTARGNAFDGLAIDMEHDRVMSRDEFNNGVKTHLHRVRLSIGPLYPIGAIVPPPVLIQDGLNTTYIGFPWANIGIDADVVMPMGYWSYRRSSPSQCSASVDTYCAYKYTKSNVTIARSWTKLYVHEIGGVARYKLDGTWHTIPDSDITDFVRGAREVRALGGSFYDYRTTSSPWWNGLAGLNNL